MVLEGKATWSVLMHLLKEARPFSSARELAREVGVSHVVANDVVRFLEFHRALTRTPGGRRPDFDRLSSLMGALRLPHIAPEREYLITPADPAAFLQALRAAEVRFALGFVSAANALAYYQPHRDLTLYVERQELRRVREVIDHVDVPVVLVKPGRTQRPRGYPLLLFPEIMERLEVVETPEGACTSFHQTYVDLLHYPLGGAHADYLRRIIERRQAGAVTSA